MVLVKLVTYLSAFSLDLYLFFLPFFFLLNYLDRHQVAITFFMKTSIICFVKHGQYCRIALPIRRIDSDLDYCNLFVQLTKLISKLKRELILTFLQVVCELCLLESRVKVLMHLLSVLFLKRD